MIISAIVARSQNNVIGIDDRLPWHLPGDMKWFKEKTINHHVIMGRTSFECLPKALPKRVNVVITKDNSYYRSDCVIVHSIEDALSVAHKAGETEAFIIGGGSIYQQTKTLWDRIYLTEVHVAVDGDTFFPQIDLRNYDLTFQEHNVPDEKNIHPYTFKVYERIKK